MRSGSPGCPTGGSGWLLKLSVNSSATAGAFCAAARVVAEQDFKDDGYLCMPWRVQLSKIFLAPPCRARLVRYVSLPHKIKLGAKRHWAIGLRKFRGTWAGPGRAGAGARTTRTERAGTRVEAVIGTHPQTVFICLCLANDHDHVRFAANAAHAGCWWLISRAQGVGRPRGPGPFWPYGPAVQVYWPLGPEGRNGLGPRVPRRGTGRTGPPVNWPPTSTLVSRGEKCGHRLSKGERCAARDAAKFRPRGRAAARAAGLGARRHGSIPVGGYGRRLRTWAAVCSPGVAVRRRRGRRGQPIGLR